MALVEATLSSALQSMAPTDSEATAIQNLCDAWASYFAGASVSGVPIGDFSAAKSAMAAALVGMSATGAGAAKITAGITSFWTTVAAAAATLWIIPPNTVTSATPPTTLSAITAALAAVFATNSGDPTKTLAQAAAAIATVLHTSGGLGGIAIVQPPPVAPPVPTPIL